MESNPSSMNLGANSRGYTVEEKSPEVTFVTRLMYGFVAAYVIGGLVVVYALAKAASQDHTSRNLLTSQRETPLPVLGASTPNRNNTCGVSFIPCSSPESSGSVKGINDEHVLGLTDSMQGNSTDSEKPKAEYVPDTLVVKLKDVADPIEVKQPVLPFVAKKPDVDKADVSFNNLNDKKLTNSIKDINKKFGVRSVTQALKGVDDPYTELTRIRANFRQELADRTRKLDERKLLSKDLSKLYSVKLSPGASIEDAVAELQKDPNVEYASPNYILHLDSLPNDTQFYEQWSLKNSGQTGGTPGVDMRMEAAWDVTKGSPNIIIGIIDSGIDYTHPDLGGCLGPGCLVIGGRNFLTGTDDPKDDMGHGTHVAGIIAAQHNGYGIAGVCPNCKLLGMKIFDKNGSGSLLDAITAVQYAVEHGAKVLNNSYGGPGDIDAMHDVINWAQAQGTVFVVAAANSGTEDKYYPGAYTEALTVAATDYNDKKTSYSTYGSWVDVSAPGGGYDRNLPCRYPLGQAILSTIPVPSTLWDSASTCRVIEGNRNYLNLSGTSMATPHVAGLAGLIMSKNPTWSAGQVIGQIKYTSDPIDNLNPGYIGKIGKGRVNAAKALSSAITEPQFTTGTLDLLSGSEKWNNHLLEPGESPQVKLPLTNDAGTDARAVNAILSTTTPGITVQQQTSSYGDLIVGGTRSNVTPFVISVGENVPPGTTINFSLKVTYADQVNQSHSVTLPFNYSVTADIGFPKKNENVNAYGGKFVDLDLDGANELVVNSERGLKAYTSDGHLLWTFGYDTTVPEYKLKKPFSIGNVDEDRNPEIVFMTAPNAAISNGDMLFVLDHTGKVQSTATIMDFVHESPVVADLDGTGPAEILVSYIGYAETGGFDYRVAAFKGNGDLIWGWKTGKWESLDNALGFPFSPPAVGDLNHDGNPEVIMNYFDTPSLTGKILILNGKTGQPSRPDVAFPNEVIRTPPALGDVNGDGNLEMIITSYRHPATSGEMKLYVLSSQGTVMPGWPTSLGQVDASAATYGLLVQAIVANLDTDSRPEIIQVNPFGAGAGNKLFAFKSDGSLLPNFPVTYSNIKQLPMGMYAANIAGDAYPEILFQTTSFVTSGACSLWAYSANGSPVASYPKFGNEVAQCFYFTGLAIGTIGRDTATSIAAFTPNPYAPRLIGNSVTLINTGVSAANGKLDWPYFYHDVESTSNYHKDSALVLPTPTPTPSPTSTPTPSPSPTTTPTPTRQSVAYSNFATTLYPTSLALFYFSYSGPAATHHIDMSTLPDMSWNTYIDFGKGTTSPVVTAGPATKWPKEYTCGKILYWRVRQGDFFSPAYVSAIQKATVACESYPSVSPTMTPTPTPTPFPYSNYSAGLSYPGPATFSFTYTGPSARHYVDVSTTEGMLPFTTQTTWGTGTSSPITIANPNYWSAYKCGQTIFWRIRRQGTQTYPTLTTPVQKSSVTCGQTSTPTPTKTPTPIPTNSPTPRPTATPTPRPTNTPTPTPSPTPVPQPTSTPTPSTSQIQLQKAVVNKTQGYVAITYAQYIQQQTYVAAATPYATVIIQGNGHLSYSPGFGTMALSLSDFLNPDYLLRGDPIKLCTGDYSICSNTVSVGAVQGASDDAKAAAQTSGASYSLSDLTNDFIAAAKQMVSNRTGETRTNELSPQTDAQVIEKTALFTPRTWSDTQTAEYAGASGSGTDLGSINPELQRAIANASAGRAPACVMEGIALAEGSYSPTYTNPSWCRINVCSAAGPFQMTTGWAPYPNNVYDGKAPQEASKLIDTCIQCGPGWEDGSRKCPDAWPNYWPKNLSQTNPCSSAPAAVAALDHLQVKARYFTGHEITAEPPETQKSTIIKAADMYFGRSMPITRFNNCTYGEYVYQHCDPSFKCGNALTSTPTPTPRTSITPTRTPTPIPEGPTPTPGPTTIPSPTPTPRPTPSGAGFSNLSSVTTQTHAQFLFDYIGPPEVSYYAVDVSTDPTMALANRKVGFAYAYPPSTTAVPVSLGWSGYACGTTFYWWVRSWDPNNRSPIQTAYVSCGTSPTPTPRVTSTPILSPTLRLTATPTPRPTATPTLRPTATPSPRPTATATPKATPTVGISPTPSGNRFSNLTAVLTQNRAEFHYDYTNSPSVPYFAVDVSTDPTMALANRKVGFAYGNSPSARVAVSTSPASWSGYRCGSTFYWWVRSWDPNNRSDIQTATVQCSTSGGAGGVSITLLEVSISAGQQTLAVTYTQSTEEATFISTVDPAVIIQGSDGFITITPNTTESRPLSTFLGTVTPGQQVRLCTSDYSLCSNAVTIGSTLGASTTRMPSEPASLPLKLTEKARETLNKLLGFESTDE